VAGHDDSVLDYENLAASRGTLVFFMGLARVRAIADGLIAAGKEPSTPAAVVSQGTTLQQRVVVAPLGAIADAAVDLASPALLVVGEVVRVSELLAGAEAVSLVA
jgi:siroheme synthase